MKRMLNSWEQEQKTAESVVNLFLTNVHDTEVCFMQGEDEQRAKEE